MKRRLKVLPLFSWTLLSCLAVPALAEPPKIPPPAAGKIDFTTQVQPLLERCTVCHGEAQQLSGLRLDRREDALRGGYSGQVILAGNSAESKLIRLVAGVDGKVIMPPVGERLTTEQIGILRAWIDQGPEWPDQPQAEQREAERPRSSHWAFQPRQRPPVPKVDNEAGVRNPIDAFVLARLEAHGVEPSPQASKQTLVRRVSLDLTGLPPSPDQVAAFLADDSPQAYKRLVDELLKSEHYGEKWAMHWLDLARYADSDGYEKDQVRPHAWRYRHWVINALNQDMPFDQFTVEQIAGDLLPNATVEQRVAAGFHRNTLKNREGGVKPEQFRFEETVDRAATIGTVWLGLTVGCAQCHDHKYDPISQKEFYQLFAFVNNLEEDLIDAPLAGEMGPYLAGRKEYLAKRQSLLDEYGVNQELMDPWEEQLIWAGENPGRKTDWDVHYDTLEKMTDGGPRIIRLPPDERTFREQEILVNFLLQWYGQVVPKKRYEELRFREAKEKLAELEDAYPQLSQARVVFEKPDPRKTHIHLRGQWDQIGVEVQLNTPGVLPPLLVNGRPTRLHLAHWLVSPENPLTARVTVNRIWQEYFGRGLVATSDNFGTQGEEPSHPELLDWLASEFVDSGWSLKRLHKLIVMSATYRQSSKARPELQHHDPNNTLFSRQNRLRLPAELVRDSALAASGLLYTKVGGPSMLPSIPEGIEMLLYANGALTNDVGESRGQDAYRRGLYIHFQRTVPYPFLMNFDSPERTTTDCRRERSNTPLQALNMLNDPVFFEAAQALAGRVVQESPGDGFGERLDYAYELCLARDPKAHEQEEMLAYYTRQRQLLAKDDQAVATLFPGRLEGVHPLEAASWVGIGRILLNLDEFITRE